VLPRIVFTLVALALPLTAQAPAVIVVDQANGPGTDFTSLQPAIDAASEGDFLLLRDGRYFGTVDGKSLLMQGLGNVRLSFFQARNLGPTQTFALRGVWSGLGGRLAFSNCEGAVFVEEALFDGLDLDGCDDVVARSMNLYSSFGGECGAALASSASTQYVYDSFLWGKTGQEDLGVPWCPSDPGITLSSASLLYLHGSSVRGGGGAFGLVTEFCPEPGLEGDGTVTVQVTDSTIDAGYQTLGGTCSPAPAIVGAAPGSRSGTARRVVCPSPLFEGQAATVEYHGDPGDTVFLASAPTFGSPTFYPVLGVYHAPLPDTTVQAIGTIPASGMLVQSFVVPDYPGTQKVRSIYLQGFFVSPVTERQLGAPTLVHVLDPNY